MDYIQFIFAAIILQASCLQTLAKSWLNDREDMTSVRYRRAIPQECAKNARLALDLCVQKVAHSDKELSYCSKIFISDFPGCFFPKPVPEGETCTKDIWIAYGKCAMGSLTFAEQFCCSIKRTNLLKQCAQSKRDDGAILLSREVKELFGSNRNALIARIQRALHTSQSHDSSLNSKNLDSVISNLIHYLGQQGQNSVLDSNNSKRSACLSGCMGLYEACINNTGVVNEEDHTVCVEAKEECKAKC